MNNKYLYTLLSIIAMAAAMNNATAQWQPPIVDYPNPNYLYQEIPCPERIAPYRGFDPHNAIDYIFLPILCDSTQEYYTMGCPFLFKGEDSTKTVTIRGVAVQLFCSNDELGEYSHELDKDHDVTVVIYKASAGSSELQVVKEQTFHIDR